MCSAEDLQGLAVAPRLSETHGDFDRIKGAMMGLQLFLFRGRWGREVVRKPACTQLAQL